ARAQREFRKETALQEAHARQRADQISKLRSAFPDGPWLWVQLPSASSLEEKWFVWSREVHNAGDACDVRAGAYDAQVLASPLIARSRPRTFWVRVPNDKQRVYGVIRAGSSSEAESKVREAPHEPPGGPGAFDVGDVKLC